MKVIRRGHLMAVSASTYPDHNAGAGLITLQFYRNQEVGNFDGYEAEYEARTFKKMFSYQKAANRFALRTLQSRMSAVITIQVDDVTEEKLQRVISGVNQSIALYAVGGKITDIYKHSLV
jgi:hypothetical protein